MKIISVTDEDTNIMFGILGIEGYLIEAQNPKDFQNQFDKILEDDEIGLILLNEKYLFRYKDYFMKLKLKKRPLIIEIPDIKAPFDNEYFEDRIEKLLGLGLGR